MIFGKDTPTPRVWLPGKLENPYYSRSWGKSWFSSAPSFTGRGVPPMCDYSLHHVATRPAKIEDKLVTTKFKNSITRGFAAVRQPEGAVRPLPRPEMPFQESV